MNIRRLHVQHALRMLENAFLDLLTEAAESGESHLTINTIKERLGIPDSAYYVVPGVLHNLKKAGKVKVKSGSGWALPQEEPTP